MKSSKIEDIDREFEPLKKLIQVMRYDPVINKKVTNILKMESYQRRIILSNWLEQLRRNNAPYTLMQSLAFLFDDRVAENVLSIVNNHKI